MLSLIDLIDFAEISRALDEHAASGRRVDDPVGPHCRTGVGLREHTDQTVIGSDTRSHRFYRKPGGPEWVDLLNAAGVQHDR
jgi:hypothetical protein